MTKRRWGHTFDSTEKAQVMATDVVFFVIAVSASAYVRFHDFRLGWWTDAVVWSALLLALMSLYTLGAYDLDDEMGWRRITLRVGGAVASAFLIIVALNYVFSFERADFFGRGVLGGLAIIFFSLSTALRVFLLPLIRRRQSQLEWLLIAPGAKTEAVASELRAYALPGSLSVLPLETVTSGTALAASRIILASPPAEWEGPLGEVLIDARLQGQMVMNLSRVFEKLWKRIPVRHLDADWFLQSEGFGLVNSSRKQKVKRLSDLIIAFLLLIITSPFMLLTMIAVRLESSGPAIYRQVRTGKNGEDFVIFKFRSMAKDAEKAGAVWAQAGDARITRVGHFIRKTRLDEIPQLVNVLRGDMSFVGPRPERPEFNEMLAREIPYYGLRHLVRPGITGWAQTMYPYGASVEDARHKLEFDLFYIKNYSLWFDLRIVLRTVRTVLFARGR